MRSWSLELTALPLMLLTGLLTSTACLAAGLRSSNSETSAESIVGDPPAAQQSAAANRIGAFQARQIRQVILGSLASVDARRWESLREALSDSVFVDYTSLFGGQPREYAADELIDNWRQLLEPFSMTKHVLGPIGIEGDDGMAQAECPVHIYHFLRGAHGGEEWGVTGHLVFTLEKRDGTWRIRRMVLEAQSQDGNTHLLREAFARAQGQEVPPGEPQSASATNPRP